jgi:predicted nucleic acid-binding protein
LVNPQIGGRLVPNDEEDDPVLETALHGRAHVLCTLDKHFHHRTVLESCRKQGIEVLTDVELLSALRDASRISSHDE